MRLFLFPVFCSVLALPWSVGAASHTDLEFAKVGDHSLKLDLHLPDGGDRHPLVVWIHGGGWKGGDKKSCHLKWLTDKGFAVASINYRLSDVAVFPAQIHDCKGAIRWLRAHADEYGYDARRIAVAGSSAGGMLAALTGTSGGVAELEGEIGGNLDHSSRVDAVVDFYGPHDFLLRIESQPSKSEQPDGSVYKLFGGKASENRELAALASAVTHVDRSDPPMLVFHGSGDKTVLLDQAKAIENAYRAKGLDIELRIFPGAGHGGKEFRSEAAKTRIETFLKKHLSQTIPPEGRFFTHTFTPDPANPESLQIGVTHRLWIPPGVNPVRGIIVHQHGCGEGACRAGQTAADDLHWQELARQTGCALLGPGYHQAQEQNCRLWCDPRNGSGEVFTDSLRALAEISGRPEISSAPWCLWGHSGGGFWASLMQMEHPERIVAIWFQSGTAHSRWVSGEIAAPEIPDAAMEIPMVANPGFGERGHERFKVAYSGCYEMVRDYRERGAPIAFSPDPASGHEVRDSRYLAIPFFAACLQSRLPEQPGNPLRNIPRDSGVFTVLRESYEDAKAADLDPVPADHPGDLNWLPNAALAAQWSEFVRTGIVTGDSTPPPAPTTVRIDNGRIGWQCRADPESGLAGFRILRNGEEIGSLPEKPGSDRFGLPLFQGKKLQRNPRQPPALPGIPGSRPTAGSDRRGLHGHRRQRRGPALGSSPGPSTLTVRLLRDPSASIPLPSHFVCTPASRLSASSD